MSAADGGPAFPQLNHINGFPQTNGPHDAGMTLRDYFAAKALQGLLADPNGPPIDNDSQAMLYAAHCYRVADAMLKARAE